MVIHPFCGATKALIRQNANHMGRQVGHWCGLRSQRERTTGFHPSVLLGYPGGFFIPQKGLSLHRVDNVWMKHLFK